MGMKIRDSGSWLEVLAGSLRPSGRIAAKLSRSRGARKLPVTWDPNPEVKTDLTTQPYYTWYQPVAFPTPTLSSPNLSYVNIINSQDLTLHKLGTYLIYIYIYTYIYVYIYIYTYLNFTTTIRIHMHIYIYIDI